MGADLVNECSHLCSIHLQVIDKLVQLGLYCAKVHSTRHADPRVAHSLVMLLQHNLEVRSIPPHEIMHALLVLLDTDIDKVLDLILVGNG